MNRRLPYTLALLMCTLVLLATGQVLPARAEGPVVHALLFFSPSCGHCHKVISEDLPPLLEKYGEQLQIAGVNTAEPGGQALYQAAIQRFTIPPERRGVPTLIMGDVVLVGSLEIPRQLPGLVEKYLAQGGVAWPDIPGLTEALAVAQPTPTATSAQPTRAASPTQIELTATSAQSTPTATSPQTSPATPEATATPHPASITPVPTPTPARTILMATDDHALDWRGKLARDPAGNTLSVILLPGMMVVVGYVLATFRRTTGEPPVWQQWAIPLLSLVGLGVAGYLAYVETQQVSAVCGPVGDCNTVQQSAYARLFGLIPIGVLGVAGYVAILIFWILERSGHVQLAGLASLALLVLTLFGTLFSIYLTFLEPFVIGATCIWCLTSAIVMTMLLALTAARGKRAISSLFHGGI